MAYSSLMGADRAPRLPSGRDALLLGPSDSSDSGSDALWSGEARADSDAAGSGERSSVDMDDLAEGADIAPDRVVTLGPRASSDDGLESTDALGPLDDEEGDGLGRYGEDLRADISDLVGIEDGLDGDES